MVHHRLAAIGCSLVIALAGCGDDEQPSPAPGAQAAGESSQAYRDAVAPVVASVDQARGLYHDVPAGQKEALAERAQGLAQKAQGAAADLRELEPPSSLRSANSRLADAYTAFATELEKAAAAEPLSTSELGDVVREHEQAAATVYDEILASP